MGNGAKIYKSIRHHEKMETDEEYRTEQKIKNKKVYMESKNKINKKCAGKNCKNILAPKTEGKFCKSCYMKELWKKRKREGGIYGFVKV